MRLVDLKLSRVGAAHATRPVGPVRMTPDGPPLCGCARRASLRSGSAAAHARARARPPPHPHPRPASLIPTTGATPHPAAWAYAVTSTSICDRRQRRRRRPSAPRHCDAGSRCHPLASLWPMRRRPSRPGHRTGPTEPTVNIICALLSHSSRDLMHCMLLNVHQQYRIDSTSN